MKFYPSIFNDCLSPIYPGPSSSNTAAPHRLGIMATDLLDGKPVHLYAEMSKSGGYFATFYGLHTDKGFLVGTMRKDMRTYDYDQSYADAEAAGLTYEFAFTDEVPAMPSEGAWLTLTSDTGDKIFMKTASLGGGEVTIDDVDGIKTFIDGKYYYLLVRVATDKVSAVEAMIPYGFTTEDGGEGFSLITAHAREAYPEEFMAALRAADGVVYARSMAPVFNIVPFEEPDMPFTNGAEMFAYAAEKKIPLWQAALDYEKALSGLEEDALYAFAEDLWDLTVYAAEQGYKVTELDGAIVKPHAASFRKVHEEGRTLSLGVADWAVLDAFAVKEYGAVHGIIAGMPAGGSAGVPISTLNHAIKAMGLEKIDGVRALITAGILGIIYYPTHYHGAWGCQAEVGISISITAGALASLMTDDLDVIERAAVLGGQSILGQVCDPIDGAGQVPCFLRNITAVPTAIVCANAALGGVETLTSLDEMVEAMLRVGHKLKSCGINDLGVCYGKEMGNAAKASGCSTGCTACGSCAQ
ncbi:MAG: hypothetical protein E7457_02080 [Ruminococcaceae bacterium]|nr:hypothetical protein [Oscillospiraceae bacterium]